MDSILSGRKVCPKCKENKPTCEYHRRTDRPGRIQSWCKCCQLERINRKNAKLRALRPPKPVIVEKRCARCGEVKRLEAFTVVKAGKWTKRRNVCPPCHNAANREYKQTNRDRVNASNAIYRASRRQELTERQRAWREAHPERYHAIHSGWKKRNPEAVRAMGNKRRMLETAAPGEHYSAAEWKAMKARYDHRCLMCRRQEPTIRLTVDHIVPVSRGGSNSIDNLQPLCKSCNSKKYRTTVDLRPLEQAAFILE